MHIKSDYTSAEICRFINMSDSLEHNRPNSTLSVILNERMYEESFFDKNEPISKL